MVAVLLTSDSFSFNSLRKKGGEGRTECSFLPHPLLTRLWMGRDRSLSLTIFTTRSLRHSKITNDKAPDCTHLTSVQCHTHILNFCYCFCPTQGQDDLIDYQGVILSLTSSSDDFPTSRKTFF